MNLPIQLNGNVTKRVVTMGLVSSVIAGCTTKQNPRLPIIIVGAGAAGIAAARELSRQSIPYLLLEANSRIGGRALTNTAHFGVPFDLGCAWLHSVDRNPLRHEASQLGFDLTDSPDEEALLYGARRASRIELERYEAAIEQIEEAFDLEGPDHSAQALFRPQNQAERAAAQVVGPLDYGVNFEDLSVHDAARQIGTGSEALLPKGLGTLITTLGTGLMVELNCKVQAIDSSGFAIRVQTDKGERLGRAVIVTVSTGILTSGAIRFIPVLPSAHQDAVKNLPMGLLNKAAFRLPDGALSNISGVRTTWLGQGGQSAYVLSRPNGQNLVVSFVGGRQAWSLERAGLATAETFHRQVLADVLGRSLAAKLGSPLLTRWGADPFSLGAYSSVTPGAGDVRTQLGLAFANGRICFAGEAADPVWATQVAGAWRSGQKAAAMMMNI